MAVELLYENRGALTECIIRGNICIVDENKDIIWAAGDPNYVTYYRSAAKPLQAVAALKYGIKEKYGLTDREASIFCASHRGEKFHIDTIYKILEKTGLKAEQFILPESYPLSEPARCQLLREGIEKNKMFHNCSGKHISLILLQKELNGAAEEYWKKEACAQREIRRLISGLAEYPESKITVGVDGCGVPVFAVPVYNMALSFLKLIRPELIEDIAVAETVRYVTKIMNENPDIISGTQAICTILNGDSNIVAKGGARGVYCFALRKEGLGIALKTEDGSEEYLPFIVMEILRQLNYSNRETITALEKTFPSELYNAVGEHAVTFEPVFKLKKYR